MEAQKGFQSLTNIYSILYKGRVAFYQQKKSGIKPYKLYDSKGYACDMAVVDKHITSMCCYNATSTHRTLLQLTRKVEDVRHKPHIDNFLPALFFSDLHKWKISSCSTACHNRKGMTTNFGPKSLTFKKGNIYMQGKIEAPVLFVRNTK
jgi:hypothetical protein